MDKNIIVKGSVTNPMQELYNNRLAKELSGKIFSTASDLIDLLKKEFSIKNDNARKIISRVGSLEKQSQ